jgi:hypothetical protein
VVVVCHQKSWYSSQQHSFVHPFWLVHKNKLKNWACCQQQQECVVVGCCLDDCCSAGKPREMYRPNTIV